MAVYDKDGRIPRGRRMGAIVPDMPIYLGFSDGRYLAVPRMAPHFRARLSNRETRVSPPHQGRARPPFLRSNTDFCIIGPMKTTLDIDDELLIKAKAASARERKSLTALIEEGLRLRLRRSGSKARTSLKRIPIYRGKGGLVGGINPLSNRSLLDAADDGA